MPIAASWDFKVEDPPSLPPNPPQLKDWGHTYVSITGNAGQGEEIPLTGFQGRHWPAIFMQAGATGLDMPPFEIHSDVSPNLDGSSFRDARVAAREIMIPVYLYGVDRYTLRELKRNLIRALNPRNGACVLKIQEAGQPPRYLTCYYKGGAEGNEGADSAGFRWMRYGIQLTAMDPYYWTDDFHVAEWVFGRGSPFLGSATPIFPLKLSEGLVSSDAFPVLNPGDTDAWPVWEIRGPVRAFKFTHATRSFGITSEPTSDLIPGGRTLTIDTRPGVKTLRLDDGTNFWPKLDANPALWPLPFGRSTIGIHMVPGGSNAKLKMTIRPRYETY
ncbi:phage tail family protein [Streptomyces rectiverticillatus]|uniref:phage tail domain-containing protein n=1 Tax=Streptomyces rectiverticillatus TaxID=173860 RepID=UPI0015C39074|nr:phage tail domain-containing protein [Streptomyces rectiverticillatus]QLE71113.1 phage tail family protein [Streptomyces rectiverticillatus]